MASKWSVPPVADRYVTAVLADAGEEGEEEEEGKEEEGKKREVREGTQRSCLTAIQECRPTLWRRLG